MKKLILSFIIPLSSITMLNANNKIIFIMKNISLMSVILSLIAISCNKNNDYILSINDIDKIVYIKTEKQRVKLEKNTKQIEIAELQLNYNEIKKMKIIGYNLAIDLYNNELSLFEHMIKYIENNKIKVDASVKSYLVNRVEEIKKNIKGCNNLIKLNEF